MLVGLGFNPLYAAGICLIANTAPVAFGAIGIPITVASQVSSIPEMAISQWWEERFLSYQSCFLFTW
jgi:lactate permease